MMGSREVRGCRSLYPGVVRQHGILGAVRADTFDHRLGDCRHCWVRTSSGPEATQQSGGPNLRAQTFTCVGGGSPVERMMISKVYLRAAKC